jgi:iron complex outermembrane receptor protein
MPSADLWRAIAGVAVVAMPIEAAQARDFAIPPGTLGKVIAQLGERAGLTIGFTDPQLAFRVSSGVQGSFSKRQALQRALAGTGTTFEFVNPRTVRIILAPPPRTRRITPPSPPRPITAPVETGGDIVVTASKQNIPLDRYAGSVDILTLDPDRNARSASADPCLDQPRPRPQQIIHPRSRGQQLQRAEPSDRGPISWRRPPDL